MASSVVNELRKIDERLARIETAVLEIQASLVLSDPADVIAADFSPSEKANAAVIAMPPEVEAAIAVRFSGDIAAAQQTRTVAQAMVRQGFSPEQVREAILNEGELVE